VGGLSTHQFLHTIGALACCSAGGCWRSRTLPLVDATRKICRISCALTSWTRCHGMDMIAARVIERVEIIARRRHGPHRRTARSRAVDSAASRPASPPSDVRCPCGARLGCHRHGLPRCFAARSCAAPIRRGDGAARIDARPRTGHSPLAVGAIAVSHEVRELAARGSADGSIACTSHRSRSRPRQ
jgi:hypothetical protein